MPCVDQFCYATHGRYRLPQVQERLRWNLEQSLRDDFADRVADEVARKGLMTVRLHCSGDVYDREYALKWLDVFARCPRTRFYAYTRSYKLPDIAEVLAAWAARRNVRLWYSTDAESWPVSVPPRVRLAFLQTAEGEVPAGNADLAFRVRALRRSPRVGLPVVCPTETPSGKARGVTCGSCQRCFTA